MNYGISRIISGIADYDKESVQPDAVAFIRRVDYRSDPHKWTLLPRTVKESGSVITDLPLWGERVEDTTYIYGNTGNIYSRSQTGIVQLIHNVPSSHGNGLGYFGEDGYLYYTNDKVIGRYGPFWGTATFTDDFLAAQGGIPTNTNSLDLEASSSQSADAPDSASLSITSDISLEAQLKPESLPTIGTEMVLISKWNENSNQRSYKFAIYGAGSAFGGGGDGSVTISADTTDAPVDSACSGTLGAYTLSATNASFAAGQIILIHQTRGTGAGTYQINRIEGYTAGTITLRDALNYAYASAAQVIVMKQYSSVTIDSGKTWTAKAWNGTVGGILAFLCTGTTTINGTISAKGKGFRGGAIGTPDGFAYQGESSAGAGSAGSSANGMGGGGGQTGTLTGSYSSGAGAGGGHGTVGTAGGPGLSGTRVGGSAGSTGSGASLSSPVFGGAGGGGGAEVDTVSGPGGNAGGLIFITSNALTIASTGTIDCRGNVGSGGSGTHSWSGGGGGSGGSVLLQALTAAINTDKINVAGGAGGAGRPANNADGGTGGYGRIHIDYLTSLSGTSTPSADSIVSSGLSANPFYELRLYISSTGSNSEIYSQPIPSLVTDAYIHVATTWKASTSTANFYASGTPLGTAVRSLTAIFNSTALLGVGKDFNSGGTARSFYDGLIDDVRVWNDVRTDNEIVSTMLLELAGSEANLAAYYKLNGSATDGTANANDMTLRNSPVYSSDVPFPGATTRQDIDQIGGGIGNTYTLLAALSENGADKQSFVPAKDPQKSIQVKIDTVGTGNWTMVVHDPQNRTVATATVLNAQLHTGHYEFVFTEAWTPVVGATYHFHLYDGTHDGKIVSSSAGDMETAEFTTYYQYLVTDTSYHPIASMLNMKLFGNGRYVAAYDASSYDPMRITLPAGYKVRCFAPWREFIAIGTTQGSSIEDFDSGKIFFWNGISSTYDFFIDVPEGGINALFGSQGTLYIIAGYQGDLLEYAGGDKANKKKRIPKITKDKQIEVLPGAIAMWQTLLRIGVGVTDSTDVEQGVYTWGSLNDAYPYSLSYDYTISTDTTQSTGMKIGMMIPVKKKLLIGWQDGVNFGTDVVDPAGEPARSGSIEFGIDDRGALWKEKQLQLIRADFEALATTHSIGVQYKLDRQADWTAESLATLATVDNNTVYSDKLRTTLNMSRHKEFQLRLNLYTTGSTSPSITGIAFNENDLGKETIL